MPLSLMGVGTRRKIKSVLGGDVVRKRLETLGFAAGVVVEVVADVAGTLILGVMDSRVAVDKDLARRILV